MDSIRIDRENDCARGTYVASAGEGAASLQYRHEARGVVVERADVFAKP